MLRFVRASLAALALVSFSACGGGGGGGGSSTPPPATLPGSLITLALQGAAAPGTTAGTIASVSTTPIMDVAHGGWTAYMMPVNTGTGTVQVLYVAQPDNTIVEVWAQGDTIPGAPARTIASFQDVWITPSGRVIAAVTPFGGGGPVFLSALVSAGAVSARAEILETGDTVANGGGATWTTIVLDSVCVTDDGTVWFFGNDSTGLERLASVAFDGGTLQTHVSEGSALPGAVTVIDLITYGVSSDGTRFAFVADTSAPEERLYSGTPGSALYLERLQVGEALPNSTGGGTIARVWERGPILVYSNNTIILQGNGSVAAIDDVFLSLLVDSGGAPLPAVILLRSGAVPPTSTGGQVADILLINQSRSTTYPMIRANLVGVPNVTVAFYALASAFQLVVFESQAAPDGGALTSAFPSLALQDYYDAANQGSLAFRNIVDNGLSGVFWSFRDRGLLRVALEGQAAPGGDTWGPLGIGAHSVADDTLAFYAQVVNGGAGLFRQH